MPDITMCQGKDDSRECPRRHECYRATAEPDRLAQSWFAKLPFDADGATCEYFYPLRPAPPRRPCVPFLCHGDRHDLECPNGEHDEPRTPDLHHSQGVDVAEVLAAAAKDRGER